MAENGPFGAPFLTPQKSALFGLLSQEMRPMSFFSGCPKWGVLGGGLNVYVEKVNVLFRSPICEDSTETLNFPEFPGPFRFRILVSHQFYTEQMDAAVLGDRLPEGTRKPLLGPGSPSLQCQH